MRIFREPRSTSLIGTTYTLYISYDSTANRFTFRVGLEEYTFGPSGLPAWNGDPNSPWKGLTTRVQINDDESFGYVSATFDNVYKNEALYDGFSLLPIDQAKWSSYEFVREISVGEFHSKVRSSLASSSNLLSRLESIYPSHIHSMRAKVTPNLYHNEEGLEVYAGIGGIFYHDDTPGTGYTGDVAGSVRIGGFGTDPEAIWQVQRYKDDAAQTWDVLAEGAFPTTIEFGTTYNLFVDWDGSQFTFRFDTEEAHYTPLTVINPPNIPVRAIGNRINNPAGKEATIEAFFDDVVMNNPDLQVVPPSVEFNNVLLGTFADQSVTVSNPGDGWLEIKNPVGPNPPFEVIDSTTCPDPPFTLDPGASCTLVIRFSPTEARSFSDALSVATNDPDQPTLTIPLHGTGVIPDITVTPLDVPFGNVLVGATADLSVTVKNEGTGDLVLGTIGPFAPPFSMLAGLGACTDGQILHPNDTCTITIQFAPLSPDPFASTFNIPSNDPDGDENPVTVNLSGKGVKFLVNPGQGAYGTPITITGSAFGTKKGKVLVGTIALKVAVWNATTIQATLSKAMVPDTYDVTVQPKDPKGAPAITETDAFEVKGPEIISVEPGSGHSDGKTSVTIKGNFFGTKKGKVYLEKDGGSKSCKVTVWDDTDITFVVPKGLSTGFYDVTVTNVVGSQTKPDAFEVK